MAEKQPTTKVPSTCRSCGARMPLGGRQCELCGWVAGTMDHDMTVSDDANDTSSANPDQPSSPDPDIATMSGVYCYMCGWKNPAGAKFCSACGTRLQQVEEESEPAPQVKKAEIPKPEVALEVVENFVNPVEADAGNETGTEAEVPSKEPRRVNGVQVGILVATSFMVVAVLYMITVFSKRAFTGEEAAAPPQQAAAATQRVESAPLSGELAAQVESISAEIEQLEGDERINKQRELVALFVNAQRLDRAAPVQEDIAESLNAAEEWFNTGHIYYDWMDRLSGEQRLSTAQLAASAYEKGLALTPGDLNIRTALAMAYLNTQTPMLGVQQIRQVLDEDPDHLQGNFYFGVMLMQINRLDQARAQFERVKELVDETDPMYGQADIMLQNLAALQGGAVGS